MIGMLRLFIIIVVSVAMIATGIYMIVNLFATAPASVQASNQVLSCDRASWYMAPSVNGRVRVPSYAGEYDDGVTMWRSMTDSDRAAFLHNCGK